MKIINVIRQSVAAALFLAAVSFAGCEDDDAGGAGSPSPVSKITAEVEDGTSLNTAVDSVKALTNYKGTVAGRGAYADGGFTIDLVATVDEQDLTAIGEEFQEEGGVTVSDPEAMGDSFWTLTGYGKSGAGEVAEFRYAASGDEGSTSGAFAIYIYTDRDVTVTGSGSEKDGDWTEKRTYRMSLKKGWNITYNTWFEDEATKTFTETHTTGAAPAGLKWWYESYRN